MSFHQNFPKRLYGLNPIMDSSKFSYKTIWVEPYCLLVKIFLKDNMGWTVLSFGQNFSQKTIWVKPYFLLVKIFSKDNIGWTVLSFIEDFLKRQYGLSFGETFLKRQYGLNRIVFCSKFLIKTKWVKLFCLFSKIF